MGFELALVLFWIGKMKLIFKSLQIFFPRKRIYHLKHPFTFLDLVK